MTMWTLAIPAVVVGWFLFVVALGTAVGRHDMERAADDRRMIRHLRTHYPNDTESGQPE